MERRSSPSLGYVVALMCFDNYDFHITRYDLSLFSLRDALHAPFLSATIPLGVLFTFSQAALCNVQRRMQRAVEQCSSLPTSLSGFRNTTAS